MLRREGEEVVVMAGTAGGEVNMCVLTITEAVREHMGTWECQV